VHAGHDVIGGAQVVHGNRTEGVGATELTALFQSVYQKIAVRPPDSTADPGELTETARRVEQEAAKGEQADPDKVRRWLGTLKQLAPDVLELAVNALTNPGAAVATGVRLAAEQLRSHAG